MTAEAQDTQWLGTLCEDVPVFPLPDLAMLPGALLPLHVFEARYRDLVAHCLVHGGGIGVATLRPGYGEDYDGSPPIHDEIGIGRIISHEPMEDGRCNIIIRALGSAIVEEEHPQRERFRRFACRWVEIDQKGSERAIQRLKLLLVQLGSTSPRAAQEVGRMMEMDGLTMVDLLAGQVLSSASERRRYLRMSRVLDRVAWMERRLAAYVVSETPDLES